ncbi:IMP cyclohydrolase [Thermococcus sp. 101 C5]|uniref:IMP cyclohydrolase n=1 Tax=Thermococcus sp. 101 C5 TaxID=2654197 RepID=UPI00128C0167|nr:IMP cyclohydrolase [Thermococcus sp. 101 C5]MPW38514.1 IMP cyclohydrolase [Thermococcus sp. 101 C5]
MRYVGRMVGVGLKEGKPFAFYRVSSRSFPNRTAKLRGDEVEVINITETNNPYVSYTAVKIFKDYAVVSNGSHTTFIAQALEWEKPKKALIHILDAMDYERDTLNTPRIGGVIQKYKDWAFLGFAGRDELWVKKVELEEGRAFFTATYNVEGIETLSLDFGDEEELAERVLKLKFAHPVLAVGVLDSGDGFRIGIKNKN